jgi:glycosyltransferase involved in cell wall biosynthesis
VEEANRTSPQRPSVLALIPAYNAAGSVASVVAGARKLLPVLVVDDGSKDETGRRAAESGATVLRQDPNQGKGAALKAGFARGLAEGVEAVITLDADGQHDPGEIPLFLRVWEARQPDLVIGARDFSRMPLTRRVANTLGRWSFSWAMGRTILDNQSGYRLLSRRMIEAVLESEAGGFEFEVETIVRCVQLGFDLDWVAIKTIYGGEGSHIRPRRHAVNFSRLVLVTRRRMRQDRAG